MDSPSFIPPLDFTRSPNSFITAYESPSPTSTGAEEERRAPLTPTPATPAEEERNDSTVFTPVKRSLTTSSTHRIKLSKRNAVVLGSESKLIKHIVPLKGRTEDDEVVEEWESYRCDIQAPDRHSYVCAEAEMKQLVQESGGRLIEDFIYVGGFLFQVPPSAPNPLFDQFLTSFGTTISINSWSPFPRPQFNGLRLSTYGILPVPAHRSSTPKKKKLQRRASQKSDMPAPISLNEVARKRMSVWLGEMARNYGSGVRYLA